ncbi:hypothetical protein AN958_05000 [Leucoagaricus sp. SymC.cos]|nr:hypothetical protein AN958_05000 [Leucoagaricus sp. SymC.cos]
MALFHSPDDFLPEPTYSFNVDNLDDDGGDYWNAYDAGQQPLQPASIKPVPGADTEDAYWAQYSSVQGSADSTIPSPKPRHRQLQPLEGDQRIFVPSTELNPDIPHSDVYNPLVPPSPSTLSHRLAALPARPDSPPLQEDDVPSSASASAISPSPQLPHAELVEAGETLTIPHVPSVPVNKDENERTGLAAAECISADEALKCTIRGLYQLWRSGEKSQQDFMALVQQAIADQS